MGLKTEDWVGIMGSIGTIMEQKRKERMDYLNQPLVKVWNEETGQSEYVRKNNAIGMPTEDPNAAVNDFDSNIESLRILYPGAFDDDANAKVESLRGTVKDAEDVEIATTYFTNLTQPTDDKGITQAQFHTDYVNTNKFIRNLRTDESKKETSVKNYKKSLNKADPNHTVDTGSKAIKGGYDTDLILFSGFEWNPEEDFKKNGSMYGDTYKLAKEKYKNYKEYGIRFKAEKEKKYKIEHEKPVFKY
tara:strand:+ start:360 stop:1097 length:738 start_codon:yes stop_codon:yes gene_type:complete